MSNKDKPMELHDLLSQKDFSELTTAERQAVLAVSSQAEYTEQRQLILASQALWVKEEISLQPPPPSVALQAALQAKRAAAPVASSPQILPLWQRVFQFSLPAWQVAAAMLLLLLSQQVFKSSPVIIPKALPIAITTDTVYIERYHTKIKTVVQPADTVIKIIYRTVDTVATVLEPILAIGGDSILSDSINYYVKQVPSDVLDYYQNKGSLSLGKDTFLQALTEQVADQFFFSGKTW